jgi:hypothetical protein
MATKTGFKVGDSVKIEIVRIRRSIRSRDLKLNMRFQIFKNWKDIAIRDFHLKFHTLRDKRTCIPRWRYRQSN